MTQVKRPFQGCLVVSILIALGAFGLSAADIPETPGQRIYEQYCAGCHGLDGRSEIGQQAYQIPMPDFADCSFISREPHSDFFAVASAGGPIRGFSELMPAFGEILTAEEIDAALNYLRTFCTDDDWPRGELNLPRPLFTEKAYPEDEAVVTALWNVDKETVLISNWLYEKRFGPRSQIEVELPVGYKDRPAPQTGSAFGIGDFSLGFKYAVYHDLSRGAIFSLGGEVVLPTGDEDDGFGKGTLVFEPYVALGKILFNNGFLHLQALAEFPEDTNKANKEYQLRSAFGWTFAQRGFGRAWSPMLEVVGKWEDEDQGTERFLDIAPQFQVTLNTRQHVMLNVGVIIPVTNTAGRPTRLAVYLLWDWFDGGFLDGW